MEGRCRPSPHRGHYWVEEIPESDKWECRWCGEIRHFNQERVEKAQMSEATTGAKLLILTEPLIAETFYQLIRKEGEKAAQKRIFWLKGLRSCRIVPLDDHHALEAGRLFLRFRHLGISLADAFSLSVA
jgi:predicted nucleic acid-binding protein